MNPNNTDLFVFVAIAALVTVHDKPLLKRAYQHALNDGVSMQELCDILTNISVYSGVPKSLMALEILKSLDDIQGLNALLIKRTEKQLKTALTFGQLPFGIAQQNNTVFEFVALGALFALDDASSLVSEQLKRCVLLGYSREQLELLVIELARKVSSHIAMRAKCNLEKHFAMLD
ncbi:carboxymuconolactone decarboxylase family protein [Pseudoalteromonas lipolytica]|uniref:carboxymuconolactone decarboxylase family protein n=1 Tax=Pseudoalteromonas lipolytica TaxID=570156 RepID=UPI003BA2CC6D